MSIVLLLLLSGALLLRAIISMYPYSGYNTPPMYGDFEAQRHWQEITINLPAKEWYENTTNNDLMYWGLDYPPLTAYHSKIMGIAARSMNSSYVALYTSRGLTDYSHKHFMRTTVLLADLFVYLPVLVVACKAVYEKIWQSTVTDTGFAVIHVAVALMYPGQILIDNGHFQYNNISLGLAAAAIAAFLYDRTVIGSILYVCALNYKQMELYHALPIFCFLLARSFRQYSKKKKSWIWSKYYLKLFCS